MISFTCSKACKKASSTAPAFGIGATIKLSPASRGAKACHNSSVMKGMKGCNMRNSASKKPKVAS